MSTLKPGSVFGHTSAGRGTTFGALPAEGVAYGSGRSATVILRVVPGVS